MSYQNFEAEPEPPPIQSESRPSGQRSISHFDLSGTDQRIVASFVCAAVGLAVFFTCFLFAAISPAAGLVLAIFARPSPLRIAAIAMNIAVLAWSFLWMFLGFFLDLASHPVWESAF